MKYQNSRYVMSTGREIYANQGIIGLSPDLHLSGGYDQGIEWPSGDWLEPEDRLTAEDMLELADEMISRWQRFRDSIDTATP
jgi:hypothetical protein